MSLFKSSTDKRSQAWFILEVDNGTVRDYQRGTREAALDDFGSWVRGAQRAGEGFTPWSRLRRLVVTGPDWVVQPDDPTDPLLIGDAALKAVLDPEEYRYVIHGPLASALLES